MLRGNTAARAFANDPRVTFPNRPYFTASSSTQQSKNEIFTFSNDTRLDLGAVSLQNTNAYERNRFNFDLDNDATAFDLGYIRNIGLSSEGDGKAAGTNYFQEELRVISNGESAFSYIAGLYYIHGKLENGPLMNSPRVNSAPAAITMIDSEGQIDGIAGFGEMTWRFGDGWKAIGGLRYTHEKRTLDGRTTRGGITLAAISDASSSFAKLTYRAILQRDLGASANVFASYSRGFKSGVYNSFSTSAASRATRPEVIDAYEIGLKSDLARWLRLNASVYYYDYKDIQLSSRDPVSGLAVLFNAAAARIKGGEVEAQVKASSNLSFRGYATYTDAKYNRFPSAQIFVPRLEDQTAIRGTSSTPVGNNSLIADVSGSRLIRAPKFTVGASVDYRVETEAGDVGLAGNIFHSSRYYWDVNNRLFQPSYTLANVEISFSPKETGLRLGIQVKNLTDEVVQNQVNPSAIFDEVSYEKPRTYGLSAALNF